MTTFLSGYYVSLTVLAITGLSLYVTYERNRKDIWFGDGNDVTLARARRAHITLLEYGVIFLLALVTYEVMGGDKSWIHPLGILFLFGRWLHVISALFFSPKSLPRLLGAVFSHTATAIVSVRVLMLPL